MRILAVISVLVLASCGADGEPEQPGGQVKSDGPRIEVVGAL